MLKSLKKTFLKDSNNYTYWIIVAIGFRIILSAFYLAKSPAGEVPGFIGFVSGDFNDYISSVENYIFTGSYYPDFRMPGYGIIYYLLRLIGNQSIALNMLIFLQFILSAVSVYFLAVTARNIFKAENLFYICFFLYLINTFATKFDFYSQPDSFTCSATIFAVYFFEKFIRDFRPKHILFSGILMCWVVFLKPVYIPLYLIFVIIIGYYFIKKNFVFVNLIKCIAILMFPLVMFESMWILRNFRKHDRIIVLQKNIYPDNIENTYYIELIKFIQAWGGDIVLWNPGADIRWFVTDSKDDKTKLQANIFTSQFNEDSLKIIKNYIGIYQDTENSKREEVNLLLSDKLKSYTESVKNEKPFLYNVRAPLKLFINFLFHPSKYGTDKINPGFFRNFSGYLNSFLYLFVVITGLTGIIAMFATNFSFDIRLIIPGIALYSLIIFPIILRLTEYRYLVPAFPFLTVCSGYFLVQSLKFKVQRKIMEHR